jgi:mycolipenoyl-CoA---2-(long-chain-fatty acyl)-trehalose mycolipenoyltransferase / long-chain-acyl-CoA---trehalose acyltransferase
VIHLGNMTFASIEDSVPEPGSMVSWHPTPVSLAKARKAPTSAVPASNMQADYLDSFRANAAQGREIPGLLVFSWDIAGRCDVRAMTYVINTHLRRHDTYRSWFEYTDAGDIVRHTISDPADIEFVPTQQGDMTPAEWRRHILATPNPLQWDCFRFVLIQRPDHFTFFVCVDHLHSDVTSICVAFSEIHTMYDALVDGRRPIRFAEHGSQLDYCVREQASLSALTLESPDIRQWIEFTEYNGGTLPGFPLPLGDELVSAGAVTMQLMDERETAEFESACVTAGARFSGGVFACAALAQYELTGAKLYCGLTSVQTRSTPADFMTVGWYTGHVPVIVPITASSFDDTVRAAQASFDSFKELSNAPFRFARDLAPWLRPPGLNQMMMFYFDASVLPLSAVYGSQSEGLNFTQYFSGEAVDFHIRVWRLEKETQVMVRFPDNPVARDSITQYLEALKSVYARVVGRDDSGSRP